MICLYDNTFNDLFDISNVKLEGKIFDIRRCERSFVSIHCKRFSTQQIKKRTEKISSDEAKKKTEIR